MYVNLLSGDLPLIYAIKNNDANEISSHKMKQEFKKEI